MTYNNMAYSIRTVDTWGEDSGLDVNIGGWTAITKSIPTLGKAAKDYGLYTNDGHVLPFEWVNEHKNELLDEACEKGVDPWVSKWVVHLIQLTEKHSAPAFSSYGVAFH